MWGWVAKAGAWIWAHKQEIAAGWRLYQKLRERRRREQQPEETARGYYARVGKGALVNAAVDVIGGPSDSLVIGQSRLD